MLAPRLCRGPQLQPRVQSKRRHHRRALGGGRTNRAIDRVLAIASADTQHAADVGKSGGGNIVSRPVSDTPGTPTGCLELRAHFGHGAADSR